jgi:hypothetical protein
VTGFPRTTTRGPPHVIVRGERRSGSRVLRSGVTTAAASHRTLRTIAAASCDITGSPRAIFRHPCHCLRIAAGRSILLLDRCRWIMLRNALRCRPILQSFEPAFPRSGSPTALSQPSCICRIFLTARRDRSPRCVTPLPSVRPACCLFASALLFLFVVSANFQSVHPIRFDSRFPHDPWRRSP